MRQTLESTDPIDSTPIGWFALQRWYRSSEGCRCAAHESKALGHILSSLFGVYIVALGVPTDHDLLTASPINQRYQIQATSKDHGVDMLAEPRYLPIADASVHVAVLLHTLEFEPEPQTVLHEVARILAPEGHIAILNFNPFSTWSLWRVARAYWRGGDGQAFRHARLLSAFTLRVWLENLGFDIVAVRYHALGTARNPLDRRHGYTLLAKKRVATLTIIKPAWRTQTAATASLAKRV